MPAVHGQTAAILRQIVSPSHRVSPLQPPDARRLRRRCRRTSLYQAIRYKKYIGSLRPAAGLSAGVVQPRRRRVDLDSRRVGRRGADGAGARRRSAASAIRACASSCRRRRSPGSRWRGAACRTSTRCSTFRSTGRSSSAARCDLVQPRLFIMMETEIWPNLLRECRAARRQDGDGQRPHLVAVVSALPAGRGRSSAACSPTSIASACRATSRRAASSTSAPIRRASRSPAA